jgi:hypothetical protein
MRRRTAHVELGRVGGQIEHRDLELVIVDVDHPKGAQKTPVPIRQRGAPRVDKRRAIGEPPDERDVGMAGDGDVNTLSEMPFEQHGDLGFAAVFGVLEVVGQSDCDSLDLNDDDVGDTRVVGDPRGPKVRFVAIPATDQGGGDPVKPVHDIENVEITAMKDPVASRQYGVRLGWKIGAG